MSHTSQLDNRYMEFLLGEQLFALPLMSVKEVIQRPDVTPVPNMPTHFEGMMNLRGQILGVFNVRKRLAAKERKNKDSAHEVVVVIEHHGVSVGMLVDEVTKVLHPAADMLKPAPIKHDDAASKFIRSVIQTGSEMVLTIDVAELLEIEKYRQQMAG
ncbi:MAG TPA: chemotaxis protein CheW [Bdellovibrionota bacterium]|nr:chemotaxis protein CheW [Bdellovibrionota bacterium]